MQRILDRVVLEKLVNKFETVIKNAESTASVIYYCDPSIGLECEEFQSAVSETKFRLKGIGMQIFHFHPFTVI